MTGPAGRNRRVVLYGNPALRQQAARIGETTPRLRRLFADLLRTMLEQDGMGLAANQLGEPAAVFAINPRGAGLERNPCCVVNPRITRSEGTLEAEEGCLSLPGLYEILARPERVRVEGVDEEGKPFALEAEGLLARAIVHEVDHLNGVLFIDHLSPARRGLLAGRLREYEAQEQAACG
ncbi:peptide deformylase [candidate division WOR-3 bacterium]|nr:peptide deformylase [candidate division WOR-3 bacterium]